MQSRRIVLVSSGPYHSPAPGQFLYRLQVLVEGNTPPGPGVTCTGPVYQLPQSSHVGTWVGRREGKWFFQRVASILPDSRKRWIRRQNKRLNYYILARQ